MWFLCVRKHLKSPGSRKSTLDDHLSWMRRQHEAGAILLSGPTPDLQFGIYLIRADSREQAEAVAASDPYTRAGDSSYELTQWNIRQIMGVGPFSAEELGLAGRGL